MDEQNLPSLISVFTELPDPRDPRGVRHLLVDLVTISVLAVICGANTFPAIYQHAQANEAWLRRIFALLSPEAWQARFLEWTRTLVLPDVPEGQDEILDSGD